MSATAVLFHLIGAVCLLLWGLRMVQTGISRGYGVQLRQVIKKNTGNRFSAFGAGLAVTILVQSSTATALITSSFARNGFITLTAAIAVMLGADVGTTLVAQVLSLDLSILPFLLMITGFIVYKVSDVLHIRQLGRVAIGISLMLFALSFIRQSVEPLKQSEILASLFASLETEPILAILVAALLAWIMHSSLAAILLISSLVTAGTITLNLGMVLLLGANIGGTIPAVIATLGSGILARRITIGNCAMKIFGVLCCLPFIDQLTSLLSGLSASEQRIIIDFHTLFNLCLGLLFLPLVPLVKNLLERFLVSDEEEEKAVQTKFLDQSIINTPALALNNASREVLEMIRHVEEMLEGVMVVLVDNDLDKIEKLSDIDDTVDELYEQIKFYVISVSREEMSSKESNRAAEILLFTTNLEHIGDIVENILTIARKRAIEHLAFSEQGLAEIETLHKAVTANLDLATSVFMSGEIKIAREMLKQKIEINKLQGTLTQNHLDRLRKGQPDSIATSALHLDILRDLRRIHSHITAVAYPVLDNAGELRKTRLKK